MSTNTWKKQQTVRFECPSGQVVYVRRPGPDLGLRSGRVAEFFQSLDPQDQEAMWDKLESMTDEEAMRVKKFIRELVMATVVTPKIHENPQGEELGIEDIPAKDFWAIFAWGSTGGNTMSVKLGEGETTLESVDTFSQGQGSSPVTHANSTYVQSTTVAPVGDQGSVGGTGV